MNLEFFFRPEPAQFIKVFYEALAANVKTAIMDHVQTLCKEAERFQFGEQLLEDFLKRVDSKEEAWLRYLRYLLECKSLCLQTTRTADAELRQIEGQTETIEAEYKEKVRAVLRRSLQSLDKHRHVFFLSRYAVLEYRNNDPEMGRSNFENLVSSFPNRSDLWGVYLDMEIKYYSGQREDLRNLFDRILALDSIKMKVAKNTFKKLLKFEEQYGGKGRAQAVKRRAAEFVKKRTQTADN